ncbi:MULTISPECIES: MFS transporter [Paenibacillus]|uniref:MFS transporter n=1 Tax=Paenibacillus naphthalenovorans TaxID=162209 RepID=A0A0U2UNZ1_9BACL|nr:MULTISPECIES: MFS transporter [Paenibacillus]ALS23713.1 MFS transporter [Paenibacillus naphthalenovorans]
MNKLSGNATVLKIVLLIMLGSQLMLNMSRPVITLFASNLGASTLEIGFLTASFAFLPLLFAIRAGKIADRFGDRLPVVAGGIGCSLGMALPFVFPAMWALFVSQVLVGLSHVFIAICLQNVLGNAAASKEQRDHYFSMLSMVVAIAHFVGPLMGGYTAEHYSYRTVFQTAMLIGMVPILISFYIPVMLRKKEETDPAPDSTTLLSLLKLPVLRNALATSALVLYSRDIFVAYFPLYGERIGMSDSSIGWIIAIQGLSMVPVRLFLSRLTAAFGRERILLLSIQIAGFAFVLIPYAGHISLLLLLSVFMGIGLGCGQPLSMSTTYSASPKNKTGEVLGLRLATNRLSQLIAPLFFGLVGSWIGLVSVFYVSGAFLIGGALLTKTKAGHQDQEGVGM